MKLAALSPDQLQKLQALEESVGATVLAYEPVDPVAELGQDDIQSLQALEAETGLILLAVSAN